MKLSNDFWLQEFTTKGWGELNFADRFMLRSLCQDILQPLRVYLGLEFGKEVALNVTSGMRTLDDFYRIKSQGYCPSPKSDHFFSRCVPVVDEGVRERFGEYFSFAVGAADVVPGGVKTEEAFECIIDGLRSQRFKIKFGQIIHEFGRYSGWIHLSNPKGLVYSTNAIESLGFEGDGVVKASPDSGKSYYVVNI